MSTTTDITVKVLALSTLDSPYGGKGSTLAEYTAYWASGTNDNQADLAGQAVVTVTGSGNVDTDLRAITGPDGDALNGVELAALIVDVPSTAGGNISLKVAASNGVAILSGTTDSITLQPGAKCVLLFPEDGGPTLGASARLINLANADAADTDVTVTTIQRSA